VAALRAPTGGWLAASSLIKATASGALGGRCAGAAARDCRAQCRRKRWRCRRRGVSGWTMRNACRQLRKREASSTSSARSVGVQRGRLLPRCGIARWWRRKAFSATSAGRLRARSALTPASDRGGGRAGGGHRPGVEALGDNANARDQAVQEASGQACCSFAGGEPRGTKERAATQSGGGDRWGARQLAPPG
jgi:hypothetical protein